MRRIVVALVVATLALTLAGCGGGGEEAPAGDTPTTDETPAAPVATDPDYAADRSMNDSDIPPGPFPSFVTTITPAVFQEKLDAGRPMLILFYDEAQQVTGDLRAEVDAVMTEYRGLVDFVTFDVGGSSTDPATLTAVTYASELSASSTPYILVVDGGGFITWRYKGYVERKIIMREVERASR